MYQVQMHPWFRQQVFENVKDLAMLLEEIPEDIYELMHFEDNEDYKLSFHKHKVNRDNCKTFEDQICCSKKTGKNCYNVRTDKQLVDCIGRFSCWEDCC
jgi:hypothetical protein